MQPILKASLLSLLRMKFEGPTPETETRQVSISFAAFIVVAAFALFGIAMAIGTVTGMKTQATTQPETTVPAQSFESAPAPAPLPAVTQPDPSAMNVPDASDTAQDNGDTPATTDQVAPAPPAPPVAVAITAPAPAAKAPASETAAAAPKVETHNPSFPTHRTAPVAAATAPQPAQSN